MRWRDDLGLLKLYGTAFDLPRRRDPPGVRRRFAPLPPVSDGGLGILVVPAVAGIGASVGGERCAGLSIARVSHDAPVHRPEFHQLQGCAPGDGLCVGMPDRMWLYQAITWRRILAAGLWLGVAAAIRLNGGMLAAMDIVALLGFGLLQQWQGTASNAIVGKMRQASFAIGGMVGIGFVVLVAIWPYAHGGLLAGPMEAFRAAEAFPDTVVVRLPATNSRATVFPGTIFPTMLLLTAPLSIAGPTLLGGCGPAGPCWAAGDTQPQARCSCSCSGSLFPSSTSSSADRISTTACGTFFVLPAAAVLAAVGLEWIVKTMARHGRHVEGMAIARMDPRHRTASRRVASSPIHLHRYRGG